MLERDLLNVAPMVTHRMPLTEAVAGIERSKTRVDAKIMLRKDG